MLKQLERSLSELIQTHKENLQVWRNCNRDLEKLVAGYKNHMEQREMFLKTEISSTELAKRFPNIKDQLLHKLDAKIYDYNIKLWDSVSVLKSQKERILELSEKCRQSREGLELSDLVETKNTQLPTAQLLELCWDIDQLYIHSHHLMVQFLGPDSSCDQTFLRVRDFEQILSDYYLS